MSQAIQHTFLAKPCLDLCAGYLSEDPRAIHGLLKYFRKLNPKSLVCLSNYVPKGLSRGLQDAYDDERFDEALLRGVDHGTISRLKSRVIRVDLSHHAAATLLALMPHLSNENQHRVMLQAHCRNDFLEQCTKLAPPVLLDMTYLETMLIVQTNLQCIWNASRNPSVANLLYSVKSPQVASIAWSYDSNPCLATRFGHLDFMIKYLNLVKLDLNGFIFSIREAVGSRQLSILTLLVNEFNSRNFDNKLLGEEVVRINQIFESAIWTGSVEIVQTIYTMSVYNHFGIDAIVGWAQIAIDLDYIGIAFFLINSEKHRLLLSQFITLFTSVNTVAMFQMLADDRQFTALSPVQLSLVFLKLQQKPDVLREFFKSSHVKNNMPAMYIAAALKHFNEEKDIALLQACKNYDAISPAKLFNILMQLFNYKGDKHLIQIAKSKQVAQFSQQQLEALFKAAIQTQHWEVVKFFTTSPHMEKISMECLSQSVVDAAKLGDLDMMAILYRYLKKKSLRPLFR